MSKANKLAQKMRRMPTSGELVMLGRLEMSGLKFRHQCQMGMYIVDFMIPSKLVVLEVDGGYHQKPEQIKKDARRDKYMITMGLTVIRVPNEEAHSFDLSSIEKLPDATPREIGQVMGRSGAWRQASNRAKGRRIKDRGHTATSKRRSRKCAFRPMLTHSLRCVACGTYAEYRSKKSAITIHCSCGGKLVAAENKQSA